jgi:CheY-like chemotaxis protein
VLVVDDEATLAGMVARLIGDVHEVATASSAEEALALIERGPSFDTVVCDLMMPGQSGWDLHAEVALRRPGLERRFVFMTGGAFTRRAADFLASVSNPRLDKPMSGAALMAAIELVARAPSA